MCAIEFDRTQRTEVAAEHEGLGSFSNMPS